MKVFFSAIRIENKNDYWVKNLGLLIRRDWQIMRDNIQQIIYSG